MAAMLRGDFRAAWEPGDEVLRQRGGQPCWDLPRHLQWIWDGTPLEGKGVLIRCYHGSATRCGSSATCRSSASARLR